MARASLVKVRVKCLACDTIITHVWGGVSELIVQHEIMWPMPQH